MLARNSGFAYFAVSYPNSKTGRGQGVVRCRVGKEEKDKVGPRGVAGKGLCGWEREGRRLRTLRSQVKVYES